MTKLSDEQKDAIKSLIDQFRQEDRAVRERQLRKWRRLQFMWEGFQHVWWNEVAHDWRVFDVQNVNTNGATTQAEYYNKEVNIFKALLESIIAALSVSIPGIIGVPDNADNSLDLQTAKACTKIAELVGKHNDEKLFWLHTLFNFVTQGQVFAHNYTKESFEFGSYSQSNFGEETVTMQNKVCPICKTNISSEKLSNAERDEFDPGPDDVIAHSHLNLGENLCPQCLTQVDPELSQEEMIVPRLVGYTNKPKSRQCYDCYGGTFVKVPNYAMNLKQVPYLCLSREVHYSLLIEKFGKDDSELAESIRKSKGSGGGFADSYDRWARLSPQYLNEYPLDTPTWNTWWLRPESFYSLSDEEMTQSLLKKLPDGVRIEMVNDLICEIENESLDDHWTCLKNPLSNYIHFEPTGEGLVPMQEITNEMASLVLQTIEHGIPQTFANPNTLNFDKYSQTEATPGQIFPATPRSGSSLSDSFYEVKTATLSQEVMPFVEWIQQMAQMVTGALPSLWGGNQPNSSRTASQYSMARAQALQRLQNTWQMLMTYWKDIHGKVIPAFIKNLAEDERYVDQDDRGNFLNVYIRKAETQGKLGSVELESADQLPISWAQKKDAIMQLLSTSNPIVQQAITAPENLGLLKDAIGLVDFVLPGEDQREYQYAEIAALTASSPTTTMVPTPQMGPMGPTVVQQPQQNPSIDTNPFDDDMIHAEICKDWLASDAGRLCKVENQAGYLNVMLHWQKHNQKVQQAQLQATQQQEQMNQSKVSSPVPKGGDQNQPIMAPQPRNIVSQ